MEKSLKNEIRDIMNASNIPVDVTSAMMLSQQEIEDILRVDDTALQEELGGVSMGTELRAYNPEGRTENEAADVADDLLAVYEKGYNDGKHDSLCDGTSHGSDAYDNYQRGMEDAWNIAKRIALSEDRGGYSLKEIQEIFDDEYRDEVVRQVVMQDFNITQIFEKLRDWEKKKNKIKIGDEVRRMAVNRDEKRYIVLSLNSDGYTFTGITSDYEVKYGLRFECYEKTGRHFDEVVNMLSKMKESS